MFIHIIIIRAAMREWCCRGVATAVEQFALGPVKPLGTPDYYNTNVTQVDAHQMY